MASKKKERTAGDGTKGMSAPGAWQTAPTAGDVDGMWRWKLSEYEELGLRQFIAEIRPLFDMTYPVQIPKEYKVTTREVRTPFVRDAGIRIASAMTKDTPVPKVPGRNATIQADMAGDIGTRWLHAMWIEMVKQNRGQDLAYQSARALTRDSESVLKVVDRVHAWANFPPRVDGEDPGTYMERTESAKQKPGTVMPFAAQVVDRTQMVFGDGEYGDSWAIEYGVYPAPYLSREFGMASFDDNYVLPQFKLGGKPIMLGYNPRAISTGANSTIKIEYMDKDWWCVVINGKMAPGFPKENPYAPFIPWFRAIAEPALYSLRYYQPALDALLTGKMNWAFLSMFPIPQFEPVATNQVQGALDLPTGDDATTPVGMRWKPGYAMMPPPGYKMDFMQPPQTGRDVDVMATNLRDLIDIAGIPGLMRGAGGARQAGYAINQLMAAANMQYHQMGNALQRQFERASEFMFHIVSEVIGEELAPVYVRGSVDDTSQWIGLKPTGRTTENVAPVDLLGPVEFKFKPIIPVDEQAMEMIGLQAWSAKAISHERLLTDFMNIEDPQGELDKIAVEQAMATDPVLHQQMVAAALQHAGMGQPTPPSGLVGPNGAPLPPSGGPPGAPPGMPGPVPQPDGRTAAGMPAVPGLTMLARPNAPAPQPQPALPTGRPAGVFPGQPGNQR